MCHTRVLPDGTVIKDAQGNLAFDRTVKYNLPIFEARPPDAQRAILARLTALAHINYGMPWLQPDPADAYPEMTFETLGQMADARPPGVVPRQGSSLLYPVQIPDLIGINNLLYLDHTGLGRHRGPADIMRSSTPCWTPMGSQRQFPFRT
jgi:hypothetical protein